MLKISKINKVILVAGLAVAFSLVASGQAFANFEDTIDPSIITADGSKKSKAQEKADKKRANADSASAAAQTAIKEKWTKARDKRDSAQKDYNAKQEAYNKCLAAGGDCAAQRQAAEGAKKTYSEKLTAYNKAQKEASELANAATKAENKAALAEQQAKEKALTAAEKEARKKERELNKAQKALAKCQKNGGDCSTEEAAVSNAQTAVDNAKYKVENAQRALGGASSSDSGGSGSAGSKEEFLKNNLNLNDADKKALDGGFDNLDRKTQARIASQMNNYKTKKEKELAEAQANCTKYSGMRSKDAQAKAREACAQTVKLEKELEEYKNVSEQLNIKPRELSEGVKNAHKVLKYSTTVQDKKNFQGVASFDAAKSVMGTGLITPGMSEKNYEAGKDVLTSVTRRAARAILELKQIVYVFAGFGLIGFAWAAIFNKISWKWFGNIAMGLFLVATSHVAVRRTISRPALVEK